MLGALLLASQIAAVPYVSDLLGGNKNSITNWIIN